MWPRWAFYQWQSKRQATSRHNSDAVFSNLKAAASRQRQRVPNETENRECLRDGWNRTSGEGKTIPGTTNTSNLVKKRVRCWPRKAWLCPRLGSRTSQHVRWRRKASVGITEPLTTECHYVFTPRRRPGAFLCGHNWALPAIYYCVTFHLNGLIVLML